ncbi:hypothetical protein [Salipiger sp. PrR003]|uniref:hypothetical protein n=1 Tax=Salipiger sp. PrR003 TaxID=2706776 RepID=UPI0013DBC7E5|nr:hypothetical protein [Salipiger sp. PrR003]NDV52633.1 hypothetical protein [Salipiger sp. PrR003]
MGPLGARDVAAFKAGVDTTCHVVYQNIIEGSRAKADGGTHAVLRDRWEADAANALDAFTSEYTGDEKESTAA